MTYRALYRTYRPQRFQQVVGQDHITRTLTNALRQGRIGHAYLFAGPRGTGKTSVARLLAKAVNCPYRDPETAEPCDRCETCQSIRDGTALDVIEIDAASNRGIDEIRDLRDRVRYAPGKCPYKVYIIDEVHMLTDAAFNALLKTLEDPPQRVLFILATTDPQKVPITILSRCQRFDFRRLSVTQIIEHLTAVCRQEGIDADERALRLIARHAAGGMRDALSLLDQARALEEDGRVDADRLLLLLGTADDEWLLELTDAAVRGDLAEGFALIERVFGEGREPLQLLRDWLEHLRNLLVLRISDRGGDLIPMPAEQLAVLRRQADGLDPERLLTLIEELSGREEVMRWSPNGRIVLETAFVRAAVLFGGRSTLDAAGAGSEAEARLQTSASSETAVAKPPTSPVNSPVEAETDAPKASGLALIQASWPRIRERLRRRSPIVYAYTEPARPVALRDSCLLVGFPRGHEFHRSRMEAPQSRQLLVEAVRSVCGLDVRVECVTMEDQEDGLQADAGPMRSQDVPVDPEGPEDGEARRTQTRPRAAPTPGTSTASTKASPRHGGDQDLLAQAVELFGGEFVTPREDLW